MNAAGFPQGMMVGQGLPQAGGGNMPNNVKHMLLNRFQQQHQTNGWQSALQPQERVNLVMQLSTSFGLANQTASADSAIKAALAFESERFNRSMNKDEYMTAMRQQLQSLAARRRDLVQNGGIGQLAGAHNMAGMPNMMPPQMQQNLPNGMQQQFQPQLARQMQPSQIPMNAGVNQGMPMTMPNQNQGFNNQPQQVAGQNFNLTPEDAQKINALAQRMAAQAKPEQRQSILKQFEALPEPAKLKIKQAAGDPITAHYRSQAKNLWIRQMSKVQGQQPQNAIQNPMLAQQNNMMQRQASNQMGPQMDQNVDFSQLMNQVAGQQQEAMRSADSGQLVVPASNNNPMMQQGINGAMPMGLNGGPQGMNAAQIAQMQLNNGYNAAQQAQMTQMRMAQQQAQNQATLQAQINAQNQIRAQQGQNQQNAMAAQMKLNQNASPMPQNAQPGMQHPNATPQQRPAAMPSGQPAQSVPGQINPAMLQMMKQGNINNQPIRRPLPPNLPPNLPANIKAFLQTADDEFYNIAMDNIRSGNARGQMANGMGNPMAGGANPQMNQLMMNRMGANGQNPINAQALHQQQLRMQQQQRNMQLQNNQQGRPQGQMMPQQVPPELMQQLDKRNFPRSLIDANSTGKPPDHVQTYLQLKEWAQQNPQQAGTITPNNVMQYQIQQFHRERMKQAPMNGNAQAMGNQLLNPQGLPAGPAPTAPMIPPGAINNNQQQQLQQRLNMGMNNGMPQMPNYQVSPQEVMQARTHPSFANLPDDELRRRIVAMKQQRWVNNMKQQNQNNMQMQGPPQNANPMLNQGMPQNSMPQPPQKTPAQATPAPNNVQNKQAQRPGQQQAPAKAPQQQTKGVKRPAPDEIIEISDNNQAAPQASQMQASKSQQGRNATQQPATAGQNNAQLAAAQQQAHMQARNMKFREILVETKQLHKKNPPVQLSPQERSEMQNMVSSMAQLIRYTDYAINQYFVRGGDEGRTRQYLTNFWHFADTVNFKQALVLGNPTTNLIGLQRLINPFKPLIVETLQRKNKEDAAKVNAENVGGQQDGQAAQSSGPDASQAPQSVPQPLNAANHTQHEANIRAAQGHRRTSSKVQAPPAPTAGPGQMAFNFSTPSPQGVPKYGEGATMLTPDKLSLANARKKQKKDSISAAVPQASPPAGKPNLPPSKKQAAAEAPQAPPQPKNLCPDMNCEYHRKGFETPELLEAHKRTVHAPPADPLKFAAESLALQLGLNSDGSPKTDTKVSQMANGMGASQGKAGASPPAGVTPLNKIPLKGSPAIDRLKTPQQTSKPLAPTSVGANGDKATKDNGAAKPGQSASGSGDDLLGDINLDPWKNSGLGQGELMEWFGAFDTVTGDWGNDRSLRSPQLTPATTPDTNVTDKTASTRDSEVFDNDGLNMTLAMNPFGDSDFWEPNIMDSDFMSDLAAVGLDESAVVKIDEKTTNMDDWDAMFSANSIDGNKVPGWEDSMNDMVF